MPQQHADPDPFLGQVLNSYRLEKKLGGGGMATVYGASHILFSRRAAVKVLHPWARDEDVQRRFKVEAEIMAKLDHPHIIKCLDYGFTPEGNPFMVLELLDGEDLFRRLAEKNRLSRPEVRSIVEQIVDALEYVHERRIVHRDLKPENIFLARHDGQDDFVKLFDFGIARIVGTARYTKGIVGTPDYMAPEQAKGPLEELDGRCDVYSLAAVAYHCLTGDRPFEGGTIAEIISKVCMDLPVPPAERCDDIPVQLSKVIMKAMAKDRNDRHPSVAEFWHDFRLACIPPTQPINQITSTQPEVAPTRLVLKCLEGEQSGKQYTVECEGAFVGRTDPGAGIQSGVDLGPQEASKPKTSVSRQHAEITLGIDGFEVRDLGSFNGTWVNETRLEQGTPHRLSKGDRLRLGMVVLVVEEVA